MSSTCAYDILRYRNNRVARWQTPSLKRREMMLMEMYEILSLLFLGGTFLIALLTYIDSRNDKRK